jgi:S1-C subfamily serine protease
VFCLRTKVEYKRVGAEPGEKSRNRTVHGTAMAYAKAGGYTYLITNAHNFGDDKIFTFGMTPGKNGINLTLDKLVKNKEHSTLVTNVFDKDKSDDIKVEPVARDKDLDIAIVRTKADIPVAKSYIKGLKVAPERGDDVYVIGFPRARFNATTKGVVSTPNHKYAGKRYDILDVTSTFGNSGSPYFFRRGAVLYFGGVVRAIMPYPRSNATNFTMGIPFKRLSKLLYGSVSPVGRQGGDKKK